MVLAQSHSHYAVPVGVLPVLLSPGGYPGSRALPAIVMANTGAVSTPPQPDDWANFLANVDSAVPPKEVLQKALAFLQVECGLQDPRSAMGVQLDDLRKHPKWPK